MTEESIARIIAEHLSRAVAETVAKLYGIRVSEEPHCDEPVAR